MVFGQWTGLIDCIIPCGQRLMTDLVTAPLHALVSCCSVLHLVYGLLRSLCSLSNLNLTGPLIVHGVSALWIGQELVRGHHYPRKHCAEVRMLCVAPSSLP